MVTASFIDEVMEFESMCSPFDRIEAQLAELKSFERVKTINPY